MTDKASTLSKALNCIQKVDSIYSQSPTAQMLVSNAPAILQAFNNLKAMTLQHEMELEALVANRQYQLELFKQVAPGMMKNLESLLNNIYSLQAEVRQYAHWANSNPDAKTVIDYTNRQIDQNIRVFNQLTFSLLNA